MQIRPTAFTIGLIIHFSIALFSVYTEFGIDSGVPFCTVFPVMLHAVSGLPFAVKLSGGMPESSCSLSLPPFILLAANIVNISGAIPVLFAFNISHSVNFAYLPE